MPTKRRMKRLATKAKFTKKPLSKMTARPAQKIDTSSSARTSVETPEYTYTTTDSKGYAKHKRKEARKKKISVSKSKVKKDYKDSDSGQLPGEAYKTKSKMVKTKKADRMAKRGWKKDLYI